MNGKGVPLAGTPMRGGRTRVLAAGRIDARRIAVDAGATTDLQTMAGRATTIFIARGAGRAIVCDEEEARAETPPAIEVQAGDVLLVPPHAHFGFVSGNEPLEVVQHSVDLDVLTA
jgi:mannose-6-phosphate isomerase-like protein (cupin superfamily)